MLVGERADVLHGALGSLARRSTRSDGDVLVGDVVADPLDFVGGLFLLRALLLGSLGGVLTLL